MQKQLGQMNLADRMVAEHMGKGAPNFLAKADEVLDFDLLAEELSGIYAAPKGRPSYPPVMLFKMLLLQQWYNLSDPGVEEAVWDRLSFRRFLGLSVSAMVPDHSTVSRFRGLLGDRYEGLLAALNAQIDARGIMVKKVTMMDASFVSAASRKRSVDGEAGVYGGQRDGLACGYKMHAAVDRQSGIVRRVITTPANTNDTVVADALVMGDEGGIYADKAYDKRARRKDLAARGFVVGIMHRPNRGKPLTAAQLAFNKRISKLRAPVEHTFGILKNHYRLRRSRYIGLQRTAVQITLACMAMNIKRTLVLVQQ